MIGAIVHFTRRRRRVRFLQGHHARNNLHNETKWNNLGQAKQEHEER